MIYCNQYYDFNKLDGFRKEREWLRKQDSNNLEMYNKNSDLVNNKIANESY